MMDDYQRVYAVVDLDAVLYNLEQIKKNIAPDTKIMGITKLYPLSFCAKGGMRNKYIRCVE